MAKIKITYKNRWVFFIFTYIWAISLYLFSNRVHIFPVHLLPLTPIDIWVPYMPWTGWIYIGVYFIPLGCTVIVKDPADIKRIVYSFLAMTTVCTTVFVLYPTVYPRPEMNLSASSGSYALQMVQSLDTPANSMPSQHVALAFLSAFFIHRYRKSWGNAAILFGILISISTLTTKQHYIWDVIIGYAMARFSYLIATYQPRRSHSEVAQ